VTQNTPSQIDELRRVFYRVLFIAKLSSDRQLDTMMQGIAKMLRIKKATVEAAIDELLAEFDGLLVQLVRDKKLLSVVGVNVPTQQQMERLNRLQGDELAGARNFFVAKFGEDSISDHHTVSRLIDDRVTVLASIA
jgi:hypothetical protein